MTITELSRNWSMVSDASPFEPIWYMEDIPFARSPTKAASSINIRMLTANRVKTCAAKLNMDLLFDISIKLWKVKHIQIETSNILTLKKISYLILTNGVLWVYWISVCIPLALQLEKNILGGSFLFLFLVEISWFISTLVATYLFSKTKSLIYDTKKQLRIVRVFSVVYIYFAVMFFYTSFKYLYKYFLWENVLSFCKNKKK